MRPMIPRFGGCLAIPVTVVLEKPHLGQESAWSLISLLHSGHSMRAIFNPVFYRGVYGVLSLEPVAYSIVVLLFLLHHE